MVRWSYPPCSLLLLATVLSTRGSPATELPFQTPCKVSRTEVHFPRLTKALGVIRPITPHEEKAGTQLPQAFHVTLMWRGRAHRLKLFQSDVVSRNMVVVYDDISFNDTVAERQEENCYYQGFLARQKTSYAALSACHGLAGYIQTEEELLFIEPAPSSHRKRPWQQQPHLIYTCEEPTVSGENHTEEVLETETPHARSQRVRRSTSRKRYLEVQLVVDHIIVAMHGESRVKNYVMTLMNIVNSVYQHHTLGVNLRVVVTEIILLPKDKLTCNMIGSGFSGISFKERCDASERLVVQKDVVTKRDAYGTVQRFCQWSMQRQNPASDVKHDIAVLLTREDLGPAGYAPITGLCNPSRACAAITDQGFTSGFIIAHEMAHIFGLFHDGHGNTCTGRHYVTAIMAPLVEAKLNHFWWSECSKQRMQQVINYLYCLNDDPDAGSNLNHYDLDSGPEFAHDIGKSWSLDFQCRLEFGHDFGLCAAFPSDACNMLWCSERSSPHQCRTKRGPPMPGSNCGYDKQCRNHLCTYVGNEKPVNGHWATWTSWEDCSVECGTGIKRRRRYCANPKPAYGGRECDGQAEAWDTCIGKNCENYNDFREGHCAVWNEMNIRHGQHDWKPYQTKKKSDLCKQTCVSSLTGEVVTLDIDVSDGTPCDYDHPTDICLLGECLMVGCDGVQNSTKVFDSCGVCGGDNSQCKTVSGHYARVPSPGEEYESIVLVPKGARSIDVVKNGRTRHFVAIKDPAYGKFHLNGNKIPENSREFIVAGARFQYTTNYDIQTIRSQGPLHSDLEIMLYPNRDTNVASVTYEYSVNKKDVTQEKRKYRWRYKAWSDCSVTCGEGVTSIMHACYDKDTDEEKPDQMCVYLEPPRKDEVPCTREPCSQMRYIWAMTNDWSTCSAAECGQKGVETQGYKCQLYFMQNDTYVNVDRKLCNQDTVPVFTRNCTAPPCKNLAWITSDWSKCSVSCGKGRQSRTVYCGDPHTDSDDMLCKDTPPLLSRPCEKGECEEAPSSDECRDKYSFCTQSHGLSFKCQSKRFQSICCKACKRQENAAQGPQLSHWTLYRLRMLKRNN